MSENIEIQKVLEEAASVGLRSRTIEAAYNILQRSPDIDRIQAYNMAFNMLLENTEEPDERDIEPLTYVDNEDDDEWDTDEVQDRFSHLEDIDEDDEL